MQRVFEAEKEFTSERAFFMKQMKEAEAKQRQTEQKMASIECELKVEK